MTYRHDIVGVMVGGLLALSLVPVSAQELTAQGINQRLLRLERVLDNSVLIDMVQRMESLQSEVRQLRGELEQKTNELESMRERQRKLYLDTDNRLQALESGGGRDRVRIKSARYPQTIARALSSAM